MAPRPGDLKPLKGLHCVLNEGMLGWIQEQLTVIGKHYRDDMDRPLAVLEALVDKEGWVPLEDKFGIKAYSYTPYVNDTEFRVGVVIPKHGHDRRLMLDMRAWGEYEEKNQGRWGKNR